MKLSISEFIRGSITKEDDAETFFEGINKPIHLNEKIETTMILRSLF